MKKVENDILTLGPRVLDNQINQKYISLLNKLLKTEDCKNIALIGNYGSGKSSLMKTFLKKNYWQNRKSLTVAIGSYIVDEDIENGVTDNKITTGEQKLVNRVEESILKQIIYRHRFSKFPKSSLLRLDNEPWCKKVLYLFSFLYTIFFIFYFYNKHFSNNINLVELFKNNFKCLEFIMALLILYFGYKFISFIVNRIKLNKIKVKDYEIDLVNNSNSLFSRYLSEIIYFFKVTRYDLVVFEDLDRFPDDIALKVVQELKELNTIINNCCGIKKMVFIYAIKDDLFKDYKSKSKFYDYNLSILPISTDFNSELNMIGLLKQKNIYNNISQDLISIVTKYLTDIRTMINIINDYCLFKDVTGTRNYDKLFAMLIYKNVYYKEYNKELKDSLVQKMLDSKKEKRKILSSNYNKKIEEIRKRISVRKEQVTQKSIDLKHLLILHATNYSTQVQYRLNNGSLQQISNFYNDSFDIDSLLEQTFELYSNGYISEEKIFEDYASKKDFVTAYKDILDDDFLDKCNTKIEEYNKSKEKLLTLNTSSLFKEYSKIAIDSVLLEDKLLYELIENDFITDDYMDYITSPVIYDINEEKESLKYSDSKFLMDVRQNNYSFETKITGFKTIIDRLKADFESPYILNYNILNYLIDNNEKYKSELETMLSQFKNINSLNLNFIIDFCLLHVDKKEFIFNKLCSEKVDLWQLVLEENSSFSINKKFFLINEILSTEKYITHIKKLEEFRFNFLEIIFKEEQDLNTLLNNDVIKDSLLILKPRFKDISKLEESNYKFVYFNNLYTFNKVNLLRIVGSDKFDISQLMLNEDTKYLYEYIKTSFNSFYEEFYSSSTIILNDKGLVIKLIYDKDVSLQSKKDLLKREKCLFRNLEGLESALYQPIIENNRLMLSWSNILDLYKNIGDEILYSFTYKNINPLLRRKIVYEDIIKKNKFFNNFILYTSKISIVDAKKLTALHIPRYEEINDFNYDQLLLFINTNSITFTKRNYNYIDKNVPFEIKLQYIHNYYKNIKSVTEFINVISLDDIEGFLGSNLLKVEDAINLIYAVFKKEKRGNYDNALLKMKDRMFSTFDKNRLYKIENNRTLLYAMFYKLKKIDCFQLLDVDAEWIYFKV